MPLLSIILGGSQETIKLASSDRRWLIGPEQFESNQLCPWKGLYFVETTEKNKGKTRSVYLVSRPRFETGTSRTLVHQCTKLHATFAITDTSIVYIIYISLHVPTARGPVPGMCSQMFRTKYLIF